MSPRFSSFHFYQLWLWRPNRILELTNITYRPGPRFALRDLSLRLEGAGITALIGPNGAGKTTLIRLASGLLAPDSGEVTLEGKRLGSFSGTERARRIAYVSQNWRPAFSFTVEQTILLGRSPWRGLYGGFEGEDDLRACEEAIELLDLSQLRNAPVTQLSGGELQRVMIGMALAQEANILMLDEPTTHLDISYQQRLLQTLRNLLKVRPLTILASIHDLNLASIYSDQVIAMKDGTIISSGTPEEVLTAERLSETFGADLLVEPGHFRRGPGIQFVDDRSGVPHA